MKFISNQWYYHPSLLYPQLDLFQHPMKLLNPYLSNHTTNFVGVRMTKLHNVTFVWLSTRKEICYEHCLAIMNFTGLVLTNGSKKFTGYAHYVEVISAKGMFDVAFLDILFCIMDPLDSVARRVGARSNFTCPETFFDTLDYAQFESLVLFQCSYPSLLL
uniref:Uncharacterized protein n=1 Tax=Spongospora subterranea TaxID=70186 RepID=A0A0H5QQ09_9EUKA|eukprot:CRZ04128.1 hypothetical protein [Spongospora subterranea]